jgi:hypothetical protein
MTIEVQETAAPGSPAIQNEGEAAPGYLVSSFELRAGLEVSLLALAALPADVLREFYRLHLSWGGTPRLPMAPFIRT